jgi:hypothetical protein
MINLKYIGKAFSNGNIAERFFSSLGGVTVAVGETNKMKKLYRKMGKTC